MKSKFVFLISTFVIVLLCQCNFDRSIPDNFDYGKIENNIYTNKYFNFKADIPQDWVVTSQAEMADVLDSGAKAIAGDDKEMSRIMEAAKITSAQLLTISKYDLDNIKVKGNPNLILMVENTKGVPNLKDGKDYLDSTKDLLSRAVAEVTIDDNYFDRTIAGKKFYGMNVGMKNTFDSIDQQYYVTLDKGFAVAIIISYKTEEGKKELMDILKSFKKI